MNAEVFIIISWARGCCNNTTVSWFEPLIAAAVTKLIPPQNAISASLLITGQKQNATLYGFRYYGLIHRIASLLCEIIVDELPTQFHRIVSPSSRLFINAISFSLTHAARISRPLHEMDRDMAQPQYYCNSFIITNDCHSTTMYYRITISPHHLYRGILLFAFHWHTNFFPNYLYIRPSTFWGLRLLIICCSAISRFLTLLRYIIWGDIELLEELLIIISYYHAYGISFLWCICRT